MASAEIPEWRKNLVINSNGRVKRSPNRVPQCVKASIYDVFDRIGGVEEMAVWAQENPTEFYKIYARLLPLAVDAKHDGNVAITVSWGGTAPALPKP